MSEGFSLQQVIPHTMSDVVFSDQSLWNCTTPIHLKNHGHHLILAPSGTGKTSLAAFLYGIRNDFSGTITLDQKELKSFSLSEWSKIRQTRLSAIFQDLRLIPHLTVEENLQLKNRLTQHKTVSEIKIMLEQLGLVHKWNQTCGTLSFGQQQRICIVRALLQPFKYLLADEPFSHIDEENIEKAKTLIQYECQKNGASLILFSLNNDYGISFQQRLHL